MFDGVGRQRGVIRVRNEVHMLDLVSASRTATFLKAGIAIVTQSGGAGVLMADRAEELVDGPELSVATKEKLLNVIPDFGANGNRWISPQPNPR